MLQKKPEFTFTKRQVLYNPTYVRSGQIHIVRKWKWLQEAVAGGWGVL